MAIGLMIADDHELIREGLRAMFARGDITVVAEACKPCQVKPLARDPSVGVVLLAVSWGRFHSEDGIELLRDIRVERLELPVLMYSVYESAALIERCRRLHANGYLVKGVDDQLIPGAIRAVCDGNRIWADQRRSWRV